MKLYPLLAAAFIAGAGVSYAAENQNGSGETNGYHLVWQDLFDADELNPMRWDIEVNGNGGGNNELQYYTDRPENVRLGDDGEGNSCLILTARRENYLNKQFTSGRLNTKGRIAFTHGKVEASIKLPKTANGLWPAFWMMGNDFDQVGWPRCGEIDIVEMGNSAGISNGTQERFFNGACHWGPGWPNASYANSSTKNYSLQDGQFHLFTLIWDDNVVKMYVDLDKYPNQNPYYKMDIPYEDNEWSPGYYFHKDNFILFDLAVGGNFTGIHNANDITALNDGNGHEASMYVNYVKIYQKGDASEHTDFLDEGDAHVDGVLAENVSNISFDGMTVYSSEDAVSVFTVSGNEIARSHTGVIDTNPLPAGIYIARNSTNALKILVK